jgi:hypothetical protein
LSILVCHQIFDRDVSMIGLVGLAKGAKGTAASLVIEKHNGDRRYPYRGKWGAGTKILIIAEPKKWFRQLTRRPRIR